MPTARAVKIREPGGPEVLAIDTIEVADPGPGQLLIRVAAAGLNRADLMQRRGLYPAPPGYPPDIPGLEYAGEVAAVGAGVRLHAVGDPVMGIIAGGGMAEYVLVHEREAIAAPGGMDLTRAAAIPEAFLTAYDAIFSQGGLVAGEHLLIHAVASGVGTAALQLARMAGANVIGTSRSVGKLERCAALGLEHGVTVRDGQFADAVRERSAGGAHVVLDMIGGAYLEENLEALRVGGRMVVIGLMGGGSAPLSMGTVLRKRLRVFGSVLRPRPLEEKATLARTFAERVVPRFTGDGSLEPVVDEVLPMSAIADAHARMEQNETFGKLILAW